MVSPINSLINDVYIETICSLNCCARVSLIIYFSFFHFIYIGSEFTFMIFHGILSRWKSVIQSINLVLSYDITHKPTYLKWYWDPNHSLSLVQIPTTLFNKPITFLEYRFWVKNRPSGRNSPHSNHIF